MGVAAVRHALGDLGLAEILAGENRSNRGGGGGTLLLGGSHNKDPTI